MDYTGQSIKLKQIFPQKTNHQANEILRPQELF